MKAHEQAANSALAGLSLAPLLVKLHPNLNVILTVCLALYVACYRSVKQTPSSETTSKVHAMLFPLVGSAMLLSLFLLFKFLSKDLVNSVLTAYLFIFGVVALSATLLPSIKHFVPKEWNDKEIVWWAPLTQSIFVAIALRFNVSRGSKNRYFICAFLGYTVNTVIMNWFQAAHSALQDIVTGVAVFVAAHCLWNGEGKQDGTNQLIDKVWGWKDMYGTTKLKKFGAPCWVPHHTVQEEDGEDDDVTAPLEEDRSNSDDEDSDESPSDDESPSEDSDDNDDDAPFGQRAVQLLAVRANFPVLCIHSFDLEGSQTIYLDDEAEEKGQEGRMVDLVIELCKPILAYGYFSVRVFPATTAAGEDSSTRLVPFEGEWGATDELAHTDTISRGPHRKVEVTYLPIRNSIQTYVDVILYPIDGLDFRSCVVYGTIKVRCSGYGDKSVLIFSCERGGSSWYIACDSLSMRVLKGALVCVPYHRKLELYIDMDLEVITTYYDDDNREQEASHHLKFTDIKFTRSIWSRDREAGGYLVEVDITPDPSILPKRSR